MPQEKVRCEIKMPWKKALKNSFVEKFNAKKVSFMFSLTGTQMMKVIFLNPKEVFSVFLIPLGISGV